MPDIKVDFGLYLPFSYVYAMYNSIVSDKFNLVITLKNVPSFLDGVFKSYSITIKPFENEWVFKEAEKGLVSSFKVGLIKSLSDIMYY